MKPTYERNCDNYCEDKDGRTRVGTQYVHVGGRTLWVCAVCAEDLARKAGIPEEVR